MCQALLKTATVPLTYIEHARNFGEHNAVMTGLRHARGAFVVTMDDDLQNPPEEVVRLFDHARMGNWDVVYTRYDVKYHERWRNIGSHFANKVADILLDKPKGLYLSSFRCMGMLVVRAVTQYTGPYPLYRRPDHAGDAPDRQYPGPPFAASGRAVQLQSAAAGAVVAESRDQFFAGAVAAGDFRRRVHGGARRARCHRDDYRGVVPATAKPRPVGPLPWSS